MRTTLRRGLGSPEHDFRIDNNGTIPQLFMQVYQLGESLRGGEENDIMLVFDIETDGLET